MDLARVSAQLRQSSAKSVGLSGNPSDYHPQMRIDLKATHHPSEWHPNLTQSDPVGALQLPEASSCNIKYKKKIRSYNAAQKNVQFTGTGWLRSGSLPDPYPQPVTTREARAFH
ncbi:hypothetical protein K435DRAFT_923201 [Dendrothele bispora CBS 962.96]|uniref:Uncharacterized protein n=1 Tax=Dendrothele bispora (strain CBS 962.96) TaxID=1314807 RepID=A0A4S8MHE6_DENBC|nr:hypothetical protein K435DRAFT_923201 [Dendrothele bispora CBS 962.96]